MGRPFSLLPNCLPPRAAPVPSRRSDLSAATMQGGGGGKGAVSETVRKQREFLEQLRKQEAAMWAEAKAPPRAQAQRQPFALLRPHPFAAFPQAAAQRPAEEEGVGGLSKMPSPDLTSMAQVSSSSVSSGDEGRRRGGGARGGGPLDPSSSAPSSTPDSGEEHRRGGGDEGRGSSAGLYGIDEREEEDGESA